MKLFNSRRSVNRFEIEGVEYFLFLLDVLQNEIVWTENAAHWDRNNGQIRCSAFLINQNDLFIMEINEDADTTRYFRVDFTKDYELQEIDEDLNFIN